MTKQPTLGFVGAGYVGGSYAKNFKKRGFDVITYALEEPYRDNKDKIKDRDIVFVCVPTPTTPKGFDESIVASGIGLVGKGKIAVIKSTMLPGMTEKLQKKFPDVILFCSPEFLSVATAQEDADHPFSNVIGMAVDDAKHREAAKLILSVLPKADFSLICKSKEAEIIKYAHNMSGYTQIIMFNILYDMAKSLGGSWDPIQEAIYADPMICNRYSNPIHKSGRGAGGACFIKDFAAFSRLYAKSIKDPAGIGFLNATQKKNIALLTGTKKDLDLLKGVYGPAVARSSSKGKTKKTSARK